MNNTFQYFLVSVAFISLIGCSKNQRVEQIVLPTEQNSDQAKETKTSKLAGGKSTPKINRPIKVAIVTWGGFAGGIKANNGFAANKESIFWNKYGIEVELSVIDDYAASRKAFRKGGDNGGVDIMWGTVDSYSLEYPAIKALKPLAFLQTDWSRGGDAIAATKDIKEVSDLKGKRIAVAEATPSHYFALYLLSQAKMNANDVSFVFTASAIEAAVLFRKGKVEAAVSWSPDIYQAAEARQGGHILASTNDATSLIADILISRGDFAEKHPVLLAKFLLGWFDGVDEVNASPESVYDLMVNGFEGIEREDAAMMISETKLPSYSDNLAFFEVTGNQMRGYDDIYNESSTFWNNLGKTPAKFNATATRSTVFLSKIKFDVEGRHKTPKNPSKEFNFDAEPQNKKSLPLLTHRLAVFKTAGKSELDENAKVILDEIAELAVTFGARKIRVVGNTYSERDTRENKTLSQKRAQAVVEYLIKTQGFPENKFIVVGAGSSNPYIDKSSFLNRNNRIDFEVVR